MVFFQLICCRKIKNKPKLIICNTDPSTKPGKHWVLFFFHNDTVDFFDSLGNDMNYYGDEFIDFAKRFSSKYQISLIQTQPQNTSICGQYCLYFAHKICNGEKMENTGRERLIRTQLIRSSTECEVTVNIWQHSYHFMFKKNG